MEIQAYIRLGSNGIGNFQFGLVSGGLDAEVVKIGNLERFEFTSDRQDEWIRLQAAAGISYQEKTEQEAELNFTWEIAQSSEPFEQKLILTTSFDVIPLTPGSKVRNVGLTFCPVALGCIRIIAVRVQSGCDRADTPGIRAAALLQRRRDDR